MIVRAKYINFWSYGWDCDLHYNTSHEICTHCIFLWLGHDKFTNICQSYITVILGYHTIYSLPRLYLNWCWISTGRLENYLIWIVIENMYFSLYIYIYNENLFANVVGDLFRFHCVTFIPQFTYSHRWLLIITRVPEPHMPPYLAIKTRVN